MEPFNFGWSGPQEGTIISNLLTIQVYKASTSENSKQWKSEQGKKMTVKKKKKIIIMQKLLKQRWSCT